MPLRAVLPAPVLLALAMLPALLACSGRDSEARSPGPTAANGGKPAAGAANVDVAAVRVGEVQRTWSAVGSLRANESVIVRPEITGRISRIGFEEGQDVALGAVLFELDDAVFLAQIAQAQANLDLSTRNAQRAEALFGRGLISPADRDNAIAAQARDQASLRLARAQADRTVIRAPFAGRAGLRLAAVGDYVNPGQDLLMLEDLHRMKLEFRLPELALPDVREGQDAQVTLDAFANERFAARLYALDSRVADDTRSIGARALLDNPEHRLRPGMFARVELVVARNTQALLVPEQSLLNRGAKSFVYVVDQGTAREVEVQTGQRQSGEVEILSGLQAGQLIVTSGLQRIGDGATVRVAAAANG